MKIIISPNSFKESISSIEAADSIVKGLKKNSYNFELLSLPIADGGDGSLDVFMRYVDGIKINKTIFDPLGNKITSQYFLFDKGKSAFIELANSSGLKLIKNSKRNPLLYNSYGTGELILSAIGRGAKKIIIALGGSATVDGGIGILLALGTKFYDAKYNSLKQGNFLNNIDKIETDKMDYSDIEFILLADVDNKLLGKDGASFVFGSQKGATKNQIKKLERGLNNFSIISRKIIDKNPEYVQGGGAAGGIAAFLKIYLNAKIYKGTDYFLDIMQFEKKIKNAKFLITGEGKLDSQTLYGKAPFVVAKKAKLNNIMTIAIVASVDENVYSDLNKVFDLIITFEKEDKKYSILNAEKLIFKKSYKLAKILKLSDKLLL